MGNSITIKLVPSKTDKIYKPQENYADLYLLMNKLHFHSINEAIQEDSTVSNLELIHHQAQEKINQIHKEESCLNILSDCLEKLVKSIKKASYSGNIFTPENKLINDFNNIVKESDLEIKPKLNIIDIEALKKDYDEILSLIEKNLNTINTRKAALNKEINDIKEYLLKLGTLKENINSSKSSIDTLEVALKNIKLKN